MKVAADPDLAAARAACARVGRVLEGGRVAELERERDGYREAARRLKALAEGLLEEALYLEGYLFSSQALGKRAEKAEAERDAMAARASGYREAARRLRYTILADRHFEGLRLERERDCAIARAKDLEAALVRAEQDFADIHDLGGSGRDVATAARKRIGRVLHPPPPPGADWTGTEHHDAAAIDPESGAQAGARRP